MKIDLNFDGHGSTILWSISRRQFFTYETDREELHRLFGGKSYYTSRSGCSGAGYILPDPGEDLIELGLYRPDTNGEQDAKVVLLPSPMGWGHRRLYVYVPWISHRGISFGQSPFVVTDEEGKKIVFARGHDDLLSTLLGWENINGREICQECYLQNGERTMFSFQLVNEARFFGLRPTRFLNGGDFSFCREWQSEEGRPGGDVFSNRLHILKGYGDVWLHRHVDGFSDQKWSEDPRKLIGHIVSGWLGAGDGLYWRRGISLVEAFYQGEENELLLSHEEKFGLVDWFSKPVDEWKAYFLAKAREYCLPRPKLRDVADVSEAEISNLDLIQEYGSDPEESLP